MFYPRMTKKKYTEILKPIRKDKRLLYFDKFIYNEIVETSARKGSCFLNNFTLSQSTGVDERIVGRCLGRLYNRGLIGILSNRTNTGHKFREITLVKISGTSTDIVSPLVLPPADLQLKLGRF